MIKNLIFDFGKVLVDYNFDFIRTFFDNEEDSRKFSLLFCDPVLEERFDRELIPVEELIKEMQLQYPQYAAACQSFYDYFQDFVIGEVPGMRELLTKLKAQGFKLYGLTNWCSRVYLTINKYDIFRLLDGQIISCEEHYIKPEPEIYQRLLDRYNLKPEECLFADDKDINIEGANQLGIQGVVFTDAAHYVEELKKLIPGISL